MRAGTEYLFIRTVTWAYRSTRGVNQRPVSNGSVGRGARSGCSVAKCSPTVRARDPIRRASSASSQASTIALSSSRESTSGVLTELSEVRGGFGSAGAAGCGWFGRVSGLQDAPRDLTALVAVRGGRLFATGDPWEPY